MSDLVNVTGYSTAASLPPAELVGRFQATAYGSPNGHGCYIVDTMTGRTLHVANGQQPQVVTETLVQPAPTQNPLVAATPSYHDELPRSPQQSNVVPTPAPGSAKLESDDAE